MEIFYKLSSARKAVFCALLLLAISAFFDGSWFGVIITALIAYFMLLPSSTYVKKQSLNNQSDAKMRDADETDWCSSSNEEEERIENANRMNQEAADRLL